MTADRWRRVEELYHSALEQPKESRAAFLEGECSDSDLRHEVESLLAQSGDGLLDHHAAELIAGARLGPYEILDVLGQGGMGTVYRARDTRMDRTVAIKVSATQFSGRFEREVRAVAALNHPHICTLYDVGPNYLVMEYVEGKALHGPLPVDRAIRLASQLLDALDAAHRKGIVHRDLKPANILVTKSGVKVLDFGLAKMESAVAADAGTVTRKGDIIGTLHYMSPEQAEGRETDTRSDLYSFGLVFYEMLTGQRASASILEEAGPPGLQRVLRRCLAKDPADRWQSAADLKVALEWSGEAAPATPSSRRKTSDIWTAASAVVVVLALAILFVWNRGTPARPSRFTIAPPQESATPLNTQYLWLSLAVASDGLNLAFTADFEGKRWLWVRPLASDTAQRLPNTQGAAMPFWSPDSRQIAYFATGSPIGAGPWMLKKITATGGPPQTICEINGADGGTWNRDGTILFAAAYTPIYRVPASGGEPRPITQLDTAHGESSHSEPEFLPDGRHFLYWANNQEIPRRALWVAALDSPERRMVMLNPTMPRFAEPDYLLFSRDGTLFAQHLDLKQWRRVGNPVALAEGVNNVRAAFSTSSNGVLVYRPTQKSTGPPASQLAWYSREGKRLDSIGGRLPVTWIRLSPDERYAAMDVGTNNQGSAGTNLYLLDLRNNVTSRLTFGEHGDDNPVWSPDSHRIVYVDHTIRSFHLPSRLMEVTIGEHAPKTIFEQKDGWIVPDDWSPDGRSILLRDNYRTILTLPLDGGRKPKPLLDLDARYSLGEVHFSPGGRWIAYHSNESGLWQVYVASFPSMTGRRQISTEGGCIPFWRKDGRELFYMSTQGKIMSVAVKAGTEFDASAPKLLFEGPRAPGCGFDIYAVTGNGERFLMIEPPPPTQPEPMHVILHWDAEIQR
ncbi:MAG: protein kinase [Candidatus Sulfopaludibacter sp.]|nr:protein kinase [Candidatus Sulfopaludibacter sp.]